MFEEYRAKRILAAHDFPLSRRIGVTKDIPGVKSVLLLQGIQAVYGFIDRSSPSR